MKNDPIVEEIRQIRYDLLALFQDLKQQEHLNPKTHHRLQPKRIAQSA